MTLKNPQICRAFLALGALCLVALPLGAEPLASVAEVQIDAAGLHFLPQASHDRLALTVNGPREYHHRAFFAAGEKPSFVPSAEMVDGVYSYGLVVVPALDPETRELLAKARETGDRSIVLQLQDAGKLPAEALVQSGAFTILGGSIVADDRPEEIVTKDIVQNDDVIMTFSLCVGNDCVNGESFGFDTVRLKENNLRIHFNDTSTSASFPSNDWRIVINDSTNGGGNYFAIEDSTAGRQPFRVDAGAPANSIRVDSGGDLGVGLENPIVEVHVVDGDSPTLRLEQNGSSGFTPQTYDLVANEANFFIRDVTNGSALVFRAKPGAPEDSIFIAADGDMGMGTDAPEGPVHVRRTSAGGKDMLHLENNGPTRIFLENTTATLNEQWRINAAADGFRIADSVVNTDTELFLTSSGNMTITGTLTTGGPTCMAGCDRVFEDDYDLPSIEENAAAMWSNSHLPAVGPTLEDGSPFNITEKMGGILNELEKAHIYIEQLHERVKQLEAERDQAAAQQ